MSEDINEVNETEEVPSELDTLKARADRLGIRYNSKIGLDKLRAKIDAVMAGEGAEESEETPKATGAKVDPVAEKKRKASELVRIRIACMNPNKRAHEGEIFSVGSSKLGTFKKYVPYDTEWHVPRIMLDMIKERRFSSFYDAKGPNGQKVRRSRLVPEFSVEELAPLTEKELKALAQRQAMAKGEE